MRAVTVLARGTMQNLSGIVQQSKTQRDRAQKEVERLNAALIALGNPASQKEGEAAVPRVGNLYHLLRARKSPRLSVLGGLNGRLHAGESERIRSRFSTIPFTDILFSLRKSH